MLWMCIGLLPSPWRTNLVGFKHMTHILVLDDLIIWSISPHKSDWCFLSVFHFWLPIHLPHFALSISNYCVAWLLSIILPIPIHHTQFNPILLQRGVEMEYSHICWLVWFPGSGSPLQSDFLVALVYKDMSPLIWYFGSVLLVPPTFPSTISTLQFDALVNWSVGWGWLMWVPLFPLKFCQIFHLQDGYHVMLEPGFYGALWAESFSNDIV